MSLTDRLFTALLLLFLFAILLYPLGGLLLTFRANSRCRALGYSSGAANLDYTLECYGERGKPLPERKRTPLSEAGK
jgi:hypothetical protein